MSGMQQVKGEDEGEYFVIQGVGDKALYKVHVKEQED